MNDSFQLPAPRDLRKVLYGFYKLKTMILLWSHIFKMPAWESLMLQKKVYCLFQPKFDYRILTSISLDYLP